VHSRDTIEELVEKKVESATDFMWQKQLRYYLIKPEDQKGGSELEVTTRQVNAQIDYGYEYLGATTRIVVTPLTDRCWLTITGALHIKLGAQPAGPAGTGKTESTKDLAKALGMYCVVYNCTDQVTYQIMSQTFSGIAQSGQWVCLDEFNRINIEVLSVIAQMLQDIKQAKITMQADRKLNK
jgi:dynein heavy chain